MPSWATEGSDEDAAIKALDKDSDRGAALVAFGLVEKRLEDLIKKILRTDEADITNQLIGGYGPLGTFAAKMRLALMLRIYGKRVYVELDKLRDIRNDFAHGLKHLTFQTPSIADRCKANLRVVEGYQRLMAPNDDDLPPYPGMNGYDAQTVIDENLADPRWRYLETCGIYASTFASSVWFNRDGAKRFRILRVYGDDVPPPWPDISHSPPA